MALTASKTFFFLRALSGTPFAASLCFWEMEKRGENGLVSQTFFVLFFGGRKRGEKKRKKDKRHGGEGREKREKGKKKKREKKILNIEKISFFFAK